MQTKAKEKRGHPVQMTSHDTMSISVDRDNGNIFYRNLCLFQDNVADLHYIVFLKLGGFTITSILSLEQYTMHSSNPFAIDQVFDLAFGLDRLCQSICLCSQFVLLFLCKVYIGQHNLKSLGCLITGLGSGQACL